MKKVLIVAVCLALVLTLVFTLGALGKKPDKPGKPEYVNYVVTLTGDVSGTIQCTSRKGLVDTYEKPVPLKLKTNTFRTEEFNPSTIYGVYFQLTEHQGTITMGYWFWFPDKATGEKLMLEVEGGTSDGWLSLEGFTVEFTNATARITGKGNWEVWSGYVNITVVCEP